jgi:hypothetical protein
MSQIKHKSMKAVAVLLALSVIQIYAQVNLAVPIASVVSEALVSKGQEVTGKLIIRGNKPIVVNGNNATTGTSILDGATLATPDGTSANVQLGAWGVVELAPNTVAMIRYVPEQVTVTLKRGCAIVRRSESAQGSIVMPDGRTIVADQPDNNNWKRAEVCFPSRAATPVVNTGAGAGGGGGLFGLGTAGTIALLSAAAVAIIGGVIVSGGSDCVPRGLDPSLIMPGDNICQ